MAAALVGNHRTDLMLKGRTFYKMTGSGNDFVFFDRRGNPSPELEAREAIGRVCRRGTGIGADGVVVLDDSAEADLRMTYFNADGSLAALCGNATLCATRLAVEIGATPASGFSI